MGSIYAWILRNRIERCVPPWCRIYESYSRDGRVYVSWTVSRTCIRTAEIVWSPESDIRAQIVTSGGAIPDLDVRSHHRSEIMKRVIDHLKERRN